MRSDALNTLDSLVTDICQERQDWKSLAEWENIKIAYGEELPDLKREVDTLRGLIQKLGEPPFLYAIYLGPSPDRERDIIVGVGTTRLEVRLASELVDRLQDLTPGQLVLLNKDQNVVAIRSEYMYGETAEIVNIIRPEGEAEVVEVIAGESDLPVQLKVRWRENEEITVTCSEELTRRVVQEGDTVQILQIDLDEKLAVAGSTPRLHVKSGGSEGTIVEISGRLYAQEVKIGDIVRIEPGLKFAFEKLPAYETGELTLEEVPDVTYDDIGGLDEQIEQIYDAIELPYLYREQFEYYQLAHPKGILLYGPPGCGKTMVAKAVANSLTQNIRNHLKNLEECIVLYMQLQGKPDDPRLLEQCTRLIPTPDEEDMPRFSDLTLLERLAQFLYQSEMNINKLDKELEKIRSALAKDDGVRSFFLNIKGPELLNKYVGETEHRIRKIFEEARRHATFYTPVIIFFDEMEAMFRTRGTGRSSDIETTIVPQFLSEIDGIESSENLIIIGASNRQDMIDPAILRPKRLDVKIKVDRPARKAAQDIFAMYLLPTLPLHSEGVIIQTPTGSPGEVVFRAAYHVPQGQQQKIKRRHNARSFDELLKLLPEGCDFRLALSLQPTELEKFSELSPTLTVREALARGKEDRSLWNKLSRFRPDLEVRKVKECLKELHDRYMQDQTLKLFIGNYIHNEWLAETMLLQAVSLLYSLNSMINVLTNKENYSFYLKDFMSGAIIANIVDRAKRRAIKRIVIEQKSLAEGISLNDVYEAIRQEFEENKDQFAHDKLFTELGRKGEDIQFVQVLLETKDDDPWSEEKFQLYNTTLTSNR